MASPQLSTGLIFSPADLNDMILPAENCVLPLRVAGIKTTKRRRKSKPGSAGAPIKAAASRRTKQDQGNGISPSPGQAIEEHGTSPPTIPPSGENQGPDGVGKGGGGGEGQEGGDGRNFPRGDAHGRFDGGGGEEDAVQGGNVPEDASAVDPVPAGVLNGGGGGIRTEVNCTSPEKRTGGGGDHEGQVASVSLSDCLSCSGCITSSEEVIETADPKPQTPNPKS